jgi:hypothetical protein
MGYAGCEETLEEDITPGLLNLGCSKGHSEKWTCYIYNVFYLLEDRGASCMASFHDKLLCLMHVAF